MKIKVILHGGQNMDPIGEGSRSAWVELPEGYKRVYSGDIKKGDFCLNRKELENGIEKWDPIISTMETFFRDCHYYLCVIRKGIGVELPCERCQADGQARNSRFCYMCIHNIVEQNELGA